VGGEEAIPVCGDAELSAAVELVGREQGRGKPGQVGASGGCHEELSCFQSRSTDGAAPGQDIGVTEGVHGPAVAALPGRLAPG